jgi:ArsR family transcriptional regulator
MDSDRRAEIMRLHAQLCQALADPKRLLILMALRDKARTVGELTEQLGVTQSNASQHLAILRDKGIVFARRDGSFVRYSLSDRRVLEAVEILLDVLATQLRRHVAHGTALRQLRPPRAVSGRRAHGITRAVRRAAGR